MAGHFWGASAVAIGGYELCAILTGLPTATTLCRQIRLRRAGQVLLCAYLLGLAWHVMGSKA